MRGWAVRGWAVRGWAVREPLTAASGDASTGDREVHREESIESGPVLWREGLALPQERKLEASTEGK